MSKILDLKAMIHAGGEKSPLQNHPRVPSFTLLQNEKALSFVVLTSELEGGGSNSLSRPSSVFRRDVTRSLDQLCRRCEQSIQGF